MKQACRTTQQLQCNSYFESNTSMTVSWRSRPKLFRICLLLCATGAVSGLIQLQPRNSAVLQGSDARFNATVQGNWMAMTWTFQGILVLIITESGDVTLSKEQFSARFCSSGDASCVEFTIHNVSRNESGPVMCTLLGGRSETAQLEVQEHGTVNITGENVTVMQGQQVEFRCVTSAWYPTPTINWTRNGHAVDSSLYNTSSMADGDTFNSTSVLKFQAESSTTVECWATVQALTNPQFSSVFLVVERGTVNITGENVTVMQGQQVEFRCVTSAWYPTPTINWTRNGHAVDSSLYNTSSMADGDTFNSTSVLKFQAESSTTVECWATVQALTNPQFSSVFLVVVPKPPDWTVLIAVVVSFGGSALLVLLIIGIIFCYKRRKEKKTNNLDEMRTQSQLSVVNAAGKGAYDNTGYVSEGQTSVAPSEHTDSGFCQAIGSNVYQVPVYGIQAANCNINTVDQSGFRKHRHVTIV
ncbi:hemicentin-2 isoform X1 [Perca fluviatilis]|uniref:hemicentin-2 isoform X1 n=1 Tax=Perca fluviatilis TaxID=8168 RepID=UPI00196624C9|nr:hemicentin-2 isoform X1 [Perca fluviatilis]